MLSDRRKLFNDIASRYELLNHLMSAGRHLAWRRAVLNRLKPKPSQMVLDLCGGTGDFTLLFHRKIKTPFSHLLLLDLSEKMLHEANKKGKLQTVQGDATALPLVDERFDIVVCGFGMRNLPSAQKGLEECYRVLKNSGELAILDLFKPNTPFTRFFYNGLGRFAVPIIGLLARRREEYRYLLESLQGFVTPQEFASWMVEAGFQEVTVQPLDGGIAHLLCGKKGGVS